MNAANPVYREQTASRRDIHEHLRTCDASYDPPLAQRVDLWEYAGKLAERAATFEAWSDGVLVGLVAAYLNDAGGGRGFVTNVSVAREFMNQGVASELMRRCLERAASRGIRVVALEVARTNEAAVALYRKLGFEESGGAGAMIEMRIPLAND